MSSLEPHRYAGAAWVRAHPRIGPMSAFGERVADMLGEWYRGIYHNTDVLLADWGSATHIVVRHAGSLSTYDNDDLTRLVLLAHREAIRVEIRARNFHYLTLIFHPRLSGITDVARHLYDSHPTMEEAIDFFRINSS